jgi:hypothetical protein
MSRIEENIAKFIRSEGKFTEPSLKSYIQSLQETLSLMEAKTMREARRIEMAKESLSGIRRHTRRLEEKNELLESQVKTLQEQVQIFENRQLEEQLNKESENEGE